MPEKEGPSTFASKSKNTSGRIGIFVINIARTLVIAWAMYMYDTAGMNTVTVETAEVCDSRQSTLVSL